MIYGLIRKGLFSLDTERAHRLSIHALRQFGRFTSANPPHNPVTVCGINFPNPIGLAAGADKDGEAIDGFAALGFGFIEVGTVTPKAQDGNPKPRQFRLVTAEGIINRNGFNNLGIDNLINNVQNAKYRGVLGINIGKNATTPIENALDDYAICLNKAYAHASYITVNISSPNTKNLRSLQYGEALDHLLSELKVQQAKLSALHGYRPIFLKIAPDLSAEEIAAVADSLVRNQIDGVIAGNTTLSRETVAGLPHCNEAGGLSGKPLCALSTALIRQLHQELGNRVPIIGSGGIHSVASGQEKIDAGAQLLQCYSGLIYQGPALIRDLAREIVLPPRNKV